MLLSTVFTLGISILAFYLEPDEMCSNVCIHFYFLFPPDVLSGNQIVHLCIQRDLSEPLSSLPSFLMCVSCVCVVQEAIISPVSPDVLYLFRVQAVCMNDMRSDFSQSMLFRGNTDTHSHKDLTDLKCSRTAATIYYYVIDTSITTCLCNVHSHRLACPVYGLTFVQTV